MNNIQIQTKPYSVARTRTSPRSVLLAILVALISLFPWETLTAVCWGLEDPSCDSTCPPTVLGATATLQYSGLRGDGQLDIIYQVSASTQAVSNLTVMYMQPGEYAPESVLDCFDPDPSCISCDPSETINEILSPGTAVYFWVNVSQGNTYPPCFCSSSVASITIPDGAPPTDEDSGPISYINQEGDPIDAFSGNMYMSRTDARINSDYGYPLEFVRSYNSVERVIPTSWAFGTKWIHNFNYRIFESIPPVPGSILLIEGTGRALNFDNYAPPPGVFYELSYDTLADKYTILRQDNTKLEFNVNGTLEKITDRDYDRLTFAYTGYQLDTVTDASGRSLTFHYDTNGRMDEVRMAGDTILVSYEYDSTTGDTLKKVTYADSSWESYEYDTSSYAGPLLTKVSNSDGVDLYYEYDIYGRATSTYNDITGSDTTNYTAMDYTFSGGEFSTVASSDETNTYTSKWYTSVGRRLPWKVDKSSCASCEVEYKYDVDGRKVASIYDKHPLFRTDSLKYNSRNQITRTWRDPDSSNEKITSFVYNTHEYHQLSSVSEKSVARPANSHYWYFYYDANSDIDSIVERGYNSSTASDTFHVATAFEHNSDGQLTKTDGPRTDVSDTTEYTYYTNGDLQEIGLANETTIGFGQRDSLGNPTWVTGPNGDTTRYNYDRRSRIRSITQHAGESDSIVTSYKYNFASDVTEITFPEGNQIVYNYDTFGRLESIENSADDSIHYEYDEHSRLTAEEVYDSADSLYKKEYYRYGSAGKLDRIFDIDSTIFTDINWAGTNVSRITDKNGNFEHFAYDALDRLDSLVSYSMADTIPFSFYTDMEYDLNGNLTKVTDPDGEEYLYSYSDRGLLVYDSSAITGVVKYEYDEAGNLTLKTDSLGNQTEYFYDALNRIDSTQYETDSQFVSYVYDDTTSAFGLGKLYSLTSQACTTYYDYDAFGRISKEINAINPYRDTTIYLYTKNGDVRYIAAPSGLVYVYTFDSAARAKRISWTGNRYTEWLIDSVNYAPFGGPKSFVYYNDIRTDIDYDERYFSERIATSSDPTVVRRRYGFDNVGNIDTITDSADLDESVGFYYDGFDRLKHAVSADYPADSLRFGYTDNGNRTYSRIGSDSVAYFYSDNKLDSIKYGDTTHIYDYDDHGNVTGESKEVSSSQVWRMPYYYDDEGRLIKRDSTGNRTEYFYNAGNLRVKKSGPGGNFYLYYDQAGRLIHEKINATDWKQDYIYLNGRLVAKIVNREQGGGGGGQQRGGRMGPGGPGGPPGGNRPDVEVFWYHLDHLGTPLKMTDSNKTVVWSGDYYPFGELYRETVSENSAHRFPGQYHDVESDLYYNWHRYYDPKIGRYRQADPIGLLGGTNQFSYVGNMPLTWTDRTGLEKKQNWWDDLEQGRFYGTGHGENAVDWWASRYDASENPLANAWYYVGGHAAALWTPETYVGTAGTLTGAQALQTIGIAASGPWTGSLAFHSAHAVGPHTYPHLQLMIRTALKGKPWTMRLPLSWFVK